MKKLIIAILIIIFCVIIVFVFMGNDEQDLGDNYYFLPEYEAIDIGFPDGATVYKASQKYVFNDIKIQGNVVNAISNTDFIIVSQRKGSSKVENDSLQYYIIAKKTDSIYGPYNTDGYLQKRKKLIVPKKLILKKR